MKTLAQAILWTYVFITESLSVFTFIEITFFKVVIASYILTNRVGQFQLFSGPHHHFQNFLFYPLSILLDVKWYLILFLICISLKSNDVNFFQCPINIFSVAELFCVVDTTIFTFLARSSLPTLHNFSPVSYSRQSYLKLCHLL